MTYCLPVENRSLFRYGRVHVKKHGVETVQILLTQDYKLSRLMIKPTKSHVQTAKTQICLSCPCEESWGPQLPNERTANTLIRLGAHAILLVLSCAGSITFCHLAGRRSEQVMVCRYTRKFRMDVDFFSWA